MIVLHQFPPACSLPNASPFGMKLESYPSMAGLAYRSCHGFDLSKPPKDKFPHLVAYCERVRATCYGNPH